MRHTPLATCAALLAALALTAPAAADDRDFLREVAAPPNLIFILDTSSSMVLSPEITLAGDPPAPAAVNGALVSAGNVPGGGDDPYSRMGIAKRVLRDFLEDVGEANIALAGYAQALPAGGQGVPQKHWVYEARAQDRFHMVESNYAYRMGYNENHSGILIDAPGTLYPQAMIGYQLYFDPESTAVTDRFGPVNAYETGYEELLEDFSYARLPFDLMPMYFGNYLLDDKGTADPSDDETLFSDGVFPFYDSGAREADGSMITEQWYYGDAATRTFPNCDPSITPTAENPDDGCLAEWDETSGVSIFQRKRRVQLNIPATWGGQPNHFLAVDGTGAPVGNTEEADTPGNDDYDGLGGSDPDYDGSETSDWTLYVASVEETNYRVCEPPSGLPTFTPTATFLSEEICQFRILDLNPTYRTDQMHAYIAKDMGFAARLTHTYFDWGAGMNSGTYLNWMALSFTSPSGNPGYPYSSDYYWDDNTGTSSPATGKYARPLDVSYPYVGMNRNPVMTTSNTYIRWYGRLSTNTDPWDGIYEVCFGFHVDVDGDGTYEYPCPDICAVTTAGSAATPTNTPAQTATITRTPTPFSFSSPTPTSPSGGVTGTPTRTNTPGVLPTSTHTPTYTATPRPPTPTQTPSRTPTP
ncbi:MAG TPA: hypothetical protein VLT32_10995, partial [Candidatus Sulfomarinibacteraceae bacterium]|nr:hypothetical protein [Candidatus Sulfomarinibacteraceae bacterium]